MGSRWIPRITSPGNGGGPIPPGGQDHFAPKYLVGNVPAGDSAVGYNTGGFMYIPDPGDCTGIVLALTLPNGPGDVWIRPGTYTMSPALTRLLVLSTTRVWGAGEDYTIIVGNATDNCIVELEGETEIAALTVRRPATQSAVGDAVINAKGLQTTNHEVDVDATLANPPLGPGRITAAILYSQGGIPPNLGWNRLTNVEILGPVIAPGAGEQNPLLMFAGVRGIFDPLGTIALTTISTVTIFNGDAGLVSIGNLAAQQGASFTCGRLLITQPRTIGIYADYSPFFTNGGQSIVLMDAGDASVQTGIWLRNAFQYEIGSTLVINSGGAGPGFTPGLILDSPAGAPSGLPTRVNLHDSTFLGWGLEPAVPVVRFGSGAEVIVGAKMVNCNIDSFGVIPPIELGLGCTNAIVALNVGANLNGAPPGGVPSVLGLGNELAHNTWA